MDDVKMDLQAQIGRVCNIIHVTQDREKWWALANTLIGTSVS